LDECTPLVGGGDGGVRAGRAAQCAHPGRSVQVDPIRPTLKAPGIKLLKVKYDKPLSIFAFKFNLRRSTLAAARAAALGMAVQVDPIKPTLKASGTKRLKLKHCKLLSSFAFKFNLRRCSSVCSWRARCSPRCTGDRDTCMARGAGQARGRRGQGSQGRGGDRERACGSLNTYYGAGLGARCFERNFI